MLPGICDPKQKNSHCFTIQDIVSGTPPRTGSSLPVETAHLSLIFRYPIGIPVFSLSYTQPFKKMLHTD